MVGSLTPNLVRHVDQLEPGRQGRPGKTAETRSLTASSDVGLELFLCRLVIICLEFVRRLKPRYLLVACLLNV